MADMIPQSNITFKVWEGNTELLGIASVDLPNISWVTQTISGAGIAGSYDTVLAGQLESMTMTINFQMVTSAATSLLKPETHTISLVAAEQQREVGKATLSTIGVKHVLEIVPQSMNGGTVASASQLNASGTYSVLSWKCTRDGTALWDIAPYANKCVIGGTDYAQGNNTVFD